MTGRSWWKQTDKSKRLGEDIEISLPISFIFLFLFKHLESTPGLMEISQQSAN